MKTGLYIGKVFHHRLMPKSHFLNYKLFQVLIDLESPKSCALFSINKFNFFSFFEKKHGPIKDNVTKPLLERIIEKLNENQIYEFGDKIYLLAMPAIFGFVFNPISIYFVENKEGNIKAIIYEVNNTFGDRHSYILRNPNAPKIKQNTKKQLHVSPFMDMDMEYDFRVKYSNENFKILISLFKNNETNRALYLTAGFNAKIKELNNINLLKLLFLMPLMTLGVVFSIHWDALKIWIKGIKYRPKPHGKISTTSIG